MLTANEGAPYLGILSLAGFQRLADIQAGQTATATFSVGVDSILLATQEGDLVREPGSFTLSFEDGSVRKIGIFEPCIYKNDHFAKTGSGQT